jgi:type VI protein secretion system component Hcp
MKLQLRRVLRQSVLVLAFVPALFVAAPVHAIDAFMAIATIPGDSVVKGHEREIVLTGYSQSFATRACSRVVANKRIDVASPGLISAATGNVTLPVVVITLAQPSGDGLVNFYRATLNSVQIDRIEVAEQGDELVERVVLAPKSYKIEYFPPGITPTVSNFTCP